MKLNGAFEPQQGAPLIGCSIGAKKYRDKQCDNPGNPNVALSGVFAFGNSLRTANNANYIQCDNNKFNGVKSDNVYISECFMQSQTAIQQQLVQNGQTTAHTATVSVFNTQRHTPANTMLPNKISTSNSYNKQDNNNNFSYKQKIHNNINANLIIDEEQSQQRKQTQLMTAITLLIAATTTHSKAVMEKLAGAFTILLSLLTNCNTSLYCTTWLKSYSIEAVMRAQQTLWGATATLKANSRSNVFRSRSCAFFNSKLTAAICVSSIFMLLPCCAYSEESVPLDFIEIETTTPEFDYASRGNKKFGDNCENTLECGFPGSICSPKLKSCQCTDDLPITNFIDKCGKVASVNESCFFNEQCEFKYDQTECRDNRCTCRFLMVPVWSKDGTVECVARRDQKEPERYIDPAMIGVLVGMALMFVIICVVLRLFSQARWRENRTIFNTPNPRLMNVSLLRESKLVHGGERRGSRMSVRAPSRQPSMVSLRPHSPNPSLGKAGSATNSHGSNASATSLRSTRSNSVAPGNTVNGQHERQTSANPALSHLATTNITSNPVAESITVEIIEVTK